MKRIFIFIPIVAALTFSACLKDKPNVDFSTTQGTYIAEITTSSVNSTTDAPSGGLAYFNGATLSFSGASDPDSVFFTVNIASDYPPTKDIAVTVAPDSVALNTYNASGPPTTFSMFPDSTFDFTVRTGTVKAGSRLDTFWVVFHPNKIDPTQSYMLPISITAAPGTIISGNLGTIYLHAIGNLIAGNYNWNFTRWNGTDSTGTNSGTSSGVQAFTPSTPTTVEAYSGYYIKPRYEISFTDSSGVATDFTVALNSADVTTMSSNGVTVLTAPQFIVADPVNGYYEIYWQAATSSGPRTVIDEFSKQ